MSGWRIATDPLGPRIRPWTSQHEPEADWVARLRDTPQAHAPPFRGGPHQSVPVSRASALLPVYEIAGADRVASAVGPSGCPTASLPPWRRLGTRPGMLVSAPATQLQTQTGSAGIGDPQGKVYLHISPPEKLTSYTTPWVTASDTLRSTKHMPSAGPSADSSHERTVQHAPDLEARPGAAGSEELARASAVRFLKHGNSAEPGHLHVSDVGRRSPCGVGSPFRCIAS